MVKLKPAPRWNRDHSTLAQAQRRVLLAPLFAHCEERRIYVYPYAQKAALAAGMPRFHRQQLYRIRYGYCRTPDWFIDGICRELGESIEQVMGQEWMQRHITGPADLSSTQSSRKVS